MSEVDNVIQIPIFFTFDNNYVVPAAVAFYSLLHKTKDDIFYKMYVLHSNITSQKQKILYSVVEKFNNAKEELSKNYKIMDDCSKAYEEISSIINKREGKNK